MPAPKHDPEYEATFEVARHIAHQALNGLANYFTSASSIASDAVMRLIGNEDLTLRNPGHAEAVATGAVRFAIRDRLRMRYAVKRGGREAILSLDESSPCDGALLQDSITEFTAYIDTQDEFAFRFAPGRPEAVEAIDAWLSHGQDIEAACAATGIDSSVMRAAILLYVPLYAGNTRRHP